MSEIIIKTFDELSLEELYKIMVTRVAVFVVEQECPYPDVDGMDDKAVHVFTKDGDNITSYLRILNKDEETAHIGRVLTTERGTGLGREILKAGVEACWSNMNTKKIYLEAQVYAKGFYEREGFAVCGEEFLEDGIPHVPMILERSK